MSKTRFATKNYYTVCGNPIAHSLSPAIHQHFAEQTGQAIFYDKTCVPLTGFKDFLNQFRDNGGCGLNVTLPFKQQAFQLMQRLTAEAQAAGSVNTIRVENNGDFYGHNTDGLGFLSDLTHHGLFEELSDKRVLILGAGGAARGIVAALLQAGVKHIEIMNRSTESAQQLCQYFESPRLSHSLFQSNALPHQDLIINATSHLQDFSFLQNTLSATSLCYDLSYQNTSFIDHAAKVGVQRIYNGYGMLLEQAAYAFEFWCGVHPNTSGLR